MKDQLVESFSGIRGIYGKSLTDQVAVKYAQVYSDHLLRKYSKIRVVIGGDSRKSTHKLKNIFIQEFLKAGFEVIDVNKTGTPAIELGVRVYKAQAGVIITASHNQPEFNGWKLLGSDGAVLPVKQSDKIINQVHNFQPIRRLNKKGKLIKKNKDLENRYIKDVLKIIKPKAIEQIKQAKFKIVADPNGAPVKNILQKLFKQLRIELIGVNMKEGVFNRKIEPNIKTLKPLVSIVKKNKADFGFGLDLDADRVEIVLANGQMVSGNQMMALGVESVLSFKQKGQRVVVNLPTSHLVHQIVKKYQGKIIEVDVGETNVVTKMGKLKSLVGGEGSCGGLIVSPSKCRDGILSVVVILALMARLNKPLEEILESYPKYFEKRIKLSCQLEQAIVIKDKLIKYFKNKGYITQKAPGKAGGIKILFNKYNWLFFRASQTELGLFRIIANGNDEKLVNQMINQGEKIFYQLSK